MGDMGEELIEELEKRGTAEIVNGQVCQVTQALDETEGTAKFLIFGQLQERKTIPIDEACAKCDFWKGRYENVEQCQERQAKEGRARGFRKVICPEQFVKGVT